MRRLRLFLALLLAPLAAVASIRHGDYLLTHTAADRNQVAVQSERYGAWRGYWAHYLRVAG